MTKPVATITNVRFMRPADDEMAGWDPYERERAHAKRDWPYIRNRVIAICAVAALLLAAIMGAFNG